MLRFNLITRIITRNELIWILSKLVLIRKLGKINLKYWKNWMKLPTKLICFRVSVDIVYSFFVVVFN